MSEYHPPAKSAQFYWRVWCGDLGTPLPRERHKILELFIIDRLQGQPLRLSVIGVTDRKI